jgi:hypothetical protein
LLFPGYGLTQFEPISFNLGACEYGQQPYLVPAHPPIEGCGAGCGVGVGGTGTGTGFDITITCPARTIANIITRSTIMMISNKSIYIKTNIKK